MEGLTVYLSFVFSCSSSEVSSLSLLLSSTSPLVSALWIIWKYQLKNEDSKAQIHKYPENKVGPDYIEHLESDQEGVEYVIGREHLNVGSSIMEGGVEDEGGEDATPLDKVSVFVFVFFVSPHALPCDYPDQGKDDKDNITASSVVDVAEDLGKLQQMIWTVVDNQD